MTKFLRSFTARRRLAIAFLIIPLLVTSVGFAGNSPLPLPANVDDIQPTELKRHLTFLASPELGGRYTLSSGNRIAARYLASQLESYGFRGAAKDGSFFQKVPFVTREADNSKSKIVIGGEEKPFIYGEDFIGRNSVTPPSAVEVSGELVFVGYGVSNTETDAYKGIDATGKIVVCLGASLPRRGAGGTQPTGDLVVEAAKAHGAKAILYLPDENMVQSWDQVRAFVRRSSRPTVARKSEGPAPLPAIVLGPDMANRVLAVFDLKLADIFEVTKKGEKPASVAKPTVCRIEISSGEKTDYGQNVVGILEGSDPALKGEYVVLSAHYDHLKATEKDIYPGADDDGSGTTAVLEIARAFSRSKPRRSIFVLFNTGEELGLVGSAYFTDQEPLVPLKDIVVDFNIDMIGRAKAAGDTNPENADLSGPDGVFVIGADKHSTELFELSEQTNKETSKLLFDYKYNDENHPLRLFYRSDHWNFGKNGIPIIFYFSGLHADYHKPTDTVDKINFEKMAKVAKVVYATAWRVANRDQRLKVDRWKK